MKGRTEKRETVEKLIPSLDSISRGCVLNGGMFKNQHLALSGVKHLRLSLRVEDEENTYDGKTWRNCEKCQGLGRRGSGKCKTCSGTGMIEIACSKKCATCKRDVCLHDPWHMRYLIAEVGRSTAGPWKSVGCSPKPPLARFLAQVRDAYGLHNPEGG